MKQELYIFLWFLTLSLVDVKCRISEHAMSSLYRTHFQSGRLVVNDS